MGNIAIFVFGPEQRGKKSRGSDVHGLGFLYLDQRNTCPKHIIDYLPVGERAGGFCLRHEDGRPDVCQMVWEGSRTLSKWNIHQWVSWLKPHSPVQRVVTRLGWEPCVQPCVPKRKSQSPREKSSVSYSIFTRLTLRLGGPPAFLIFCKFHFSVLFSNI